MNTDFASLLTGYLSHYLPIQRGLSENTVLSYRDTFKILLKYCRDIKKMNVGKLKLKQIDKRFVEEFMLFLLTERKVSANTYNQRLSAIHAFFDYVGAEAPEHIAQCQQIINIPSKTTPDKQAAYLSGIQLQKVLAMPDGSTPQGRRHQTILSLLYDSGARVSELVDIKIKDVRLEFPATLLLHGKGNKERTIAIMPQSAELLRAYFKENKINPRIHGDMPLFWSKNHQKLTRSGIRYILEKYTEKARDQAPDIPEKVSPHTFRHSKAMHLVQSDVNTIYIKDFLGHADLSTTEVYARADIETKREVLEKASSRLELPKPKPHYEDAELLEWLTALGQHH